MQFIIIQIFIYFLTPRSQLFSITQDLYSFAEELYSNQMTVHIIKTRENQELCKGKENVMKKKTTTTTLLPFDSLLHI